jgi:hypothetical protein
MGVCLCYSPFSGPDCSYNGTQSNLLYFIFLTNNAGTLPFILDLDSGGIIITPTINTTNVTFNFALTEIREIDPYNSTLVLFFCFVFLFCFLFCFLFSFD